MGITNPNGAFGYAPGEPGQFVTETATYIADRDLNAGQAVEILSIAASAGDVPGAQTAGAASETAVGIAQGPAATGETVVVVTAGLVSAIVDGAVVANDVLVVGTNELVAGAAAAGQLSAVALEPAGVADTAGDQRALVLLRR